MAEAAIAAEGLSKRFGETAAARSVGFELGVGEVLGVLGPSGCGKTTLLRLLAGFERPDAGVVRVGGRTVVGPGVWAPPERRRVGMVAQDFALFPHLTVGQNVAFGLGGHGAASWASWAGVWTRRLGRGALPARAAEMLELVGLGDFAERYPHELSGGEAQRVALARALAPDPATVLLDEPFSNLDQNLRASLRAQLREVLRAAGTAAVFVTHDREEALSLADRIAVMRDGQIEQLGTPAELYHHPTSRFVAAFVGHANFLPGVKAAGSATAPTADTELGPLPINGPGAAALKGAALDVLLRPEQLSLHPPSQTEDPTCQARITSSEYYGHDQLVQVILNNGQKLEARLPGAHHWQPNDRATLRITPPALAFPADPSLPNPTFPTPPPVSPLPEGS